MGRNWQERINYAVDNYMARGTRAMISGLAIISFAMIIVFAAMISFGGICVDNNGSRAGFFEASWISLVRTLDPGVMGQDVGVGFRIIALAVTLCGIFIISTLIGILTAAIEDRVNNLRRGKSKVIEQNHTVILGWSSQILTILKELMDANDNLEKRRIVILSNKDKIEMENEVARHFGGKSFRDIICRTGDPVEASDLDMVSIQTSKSIIILSPNSQNPDAQIVKTLLAINNLKGERKDGFNIVAEIRDPKNFEVATMVAEKGTELILTSEMISRIIAQTCRQSGLSLIYEELLNFEGDEMYIKTIPDLDNKTFGEAMFMFKDSTLIGICHGSSAELNPKPDTVIMPGESIIAISSDFGSVIISDGNAGSINEEVLSTNHVGKKKSENILILGWNWKVPAIIKELEHYLEPGSKVRIISEFLDASYQIERLYPSINNQEVICQKGDVTDRSTLDSLNIPDYSAVIVLPYKSDDGKEEDEKTLFTLLHLRDIACKHPESSFAIVSEMKDIRNKQLAEKAHADDFIISERITGLLLSQVAERKEMHSIFSDIFNSEGSEIYMDEVEAYVKTSIEVDFFSVTEAGRRKERIPIGYRIWGLRNDKDRKFGIVINPTKSDRIVFEKEDRIIAFAERELYSRELTQCNEV